MSVIAACRRIGAEIARDPRYGHTSHLRVQIDGAVIFDEHYRGPMVADVFSVTKSVLATVAGTAAREGLLPDLDSPVIAGQTWRHLLTMTRGAAVDGPWESDAVTALPSGHAAAFAQAPRVHEPGTVFAYDDGSFHLLSAALTDVLGGPVADYAAEKLFRPLGIEDALWRADPDGVTYGFAHLSLSAESLGRLGEEWRAGTLMDPDFKAAMTRPQNAGGMPEGLPYGYGIWIGDGYVMAGGWAGQHVLVLPGVVVVTTGDPGYSPGPPPGDALSPDWRPALDLIRAELLPLL
ncbi:serine hydrolase domain-containing protein [Actinoplanes philippinensis]|uniref:serine hydrolase domain-containing protein n=1 Tax=Actinoplanes philippinensis TaxID=35752 RepID=UPI0033F21AEB